MSDLLSIGASGVRAYQSALGTVSENIANTGVAGYSRRTATLNEVSATSTGLATRGVSAGNGVIASGVSRASDSYAVANVRVAATDLGKTESGISWLQRIDGALTGAQLGDRLTGFFNASTAVAADPTASAPRAAMLEAGTSVADAFSATGSALTQAMSDLDGTAEHAVATLGSLGTALGKINDGLGRTAAGTTGSAQLLDQRDQILEQMSAITDVSVTTDAAGRATVSLGGSGGPVFVAGTEAGAVTYVRSGGEVSFVVHRAGTTTALVSQGGALAGLVDGAQRIADAQGEVNQLAQNFAGGVNAVQAEGRDLDGAAGQPMFATGASPSDLTLALTEPRGIAAAAVGGGVRDNSNLAGLTSLRTNGNFEGRLTDDVTSNASVLSARQTVADAQTSIHDAAVSARDGVSGVNLDNEAVDLLRFQQAYSASSRVIQVARETLQSILDIR